MSAIVSRRGEFEDEPAESPDDEGSSDGCTDDRESESITDYVHA